MKLKNYITGLFIGIIFFTGYLIFQYPLDELIDDDIAMQAIVNNTFDIDINNIIEDEDLLSNENDEYYTSQHTYYELGMKNFITQDERRDLFQQLDLEYLEREIFDYIPTESMDAKLTEAYLEDTESHDDYSMRYQNDIQEGVLAPISVRWLGSEVGYGIFAEKNILQDEFIGIYTGHIQDRSLVDSKDYAWAYPAKTIEGESLSLDGRFKGNELRFVNDNIDPNCTMIFFIGKDHLWHGCYIALRDIKEGEQLFISYGPAYWETRDYEYKELA